MARLFEEHLTRACACLDGAWRMQADPCDVGESEQWNLGLPNGAFTSVPSVFNLREGMLDYEGAVFYEKDFFSGGGCLRLTFDGVLTKAKVWLDGDLLGTHTGGFTGFSFIVPNAAKGWHRLTVCADNRFDAHSIPQKKVDWYHWGGIIRSVRVETLRGIAILSERMEYTLDDALTSAAVRVVMRLYNASGAETSDAVRVALDGEEAASVSLTLKPHETREVTTQPFSVQSPRLWSPESPALYTLSLSTATDDLADRVGFRLVEVKNGQVLLNHRPVEFRGVNRHEEHPDFGFAFPQSLMARDLELIRNLGCNAVRGSHYPNRKDFLDLLDESGLMFWSEIPTWGCGFSREALADPLIVAGGLEMHREMLEQYYNHPCILFWGMHNEIPSDCAAAVEMSRSYYRYLKERGGNRLVVYASNQPEKDLCLQDCDCVCLNIYLGWYEGNLSDWDGYTDRILERLRALGVADKPILYSEFGAAALFGCHDEDTVLWSEEYQAKLLAHCLRVFHSHPAVVGAFVWQFADIRTCLAAGINRARGFNNKGILNEYRKPKLAYHAVRQCYLEFARAESETNGKGDMKP